MKSIVVFVFVEQTHAFASHCWKYCEESNRTSWVNLKFLSAWSRTVTAALHSCSLPPIDCSASGLAPVHPFPSTPLDPCSMMHLWCRGLLLAFKHVAVMLCSFLCEKIAPFRLLLLLLSFIDDEAVSAGSYVTATSGAAATHLPG